MIGASAIMLLWWLSLWSTPAGQQTQKLYIVNHMMLLKHQDKPITIKYPFNIRHCPEGLWYAELQWYCIWHIAAILAQWLADIVSDSHSENRAVNKTSFDTALSLSFDWRNEQECQLSQTDHASTDAVDSGGKLLVKDLQILTKYHYKDVSIVVLDKQFSELFEIWVRKRSSNSYQIPLLVKCRFFTESVVDDVTANLLDSITGQKQSMSSRSHSWSSLLQSPSKVYHTIVNKDWDGRCTEEQPCNAQPVLYDGCRRWKPFPLLSVYNSLTADDSCRSHTAIEPSTCTGVTNHHMIIHLHRRHQSL